MHLQPVQFHDPNQTPYELRNWYIDGRLTMYSDAYTNKIITDRDGAHSEWGLFWKADTFGDPKKQECLTVGRVQADLLRSGWSSPWRSVLQAVAASQVCPARTNCFIRVLSPVPSEAHSLGRQRDLNTKQWGRLPFGQFFGTGESANSCVTGFYVEARL